MSHTLDVSDCGGHGHAIGRQGAKGHPMPKSDADKQAGAFVPQNMYSDMQGGSAMDDPMTDEDYGTVDKGNTSGT